MTVQWGLLKPYNVNEALGQFSQGLLTPSLMKRQNAQAELYKQKALKEQQLMTAQNRYAQTGDPKELMAVNPELAMQIEDYVRTRPPEEMVKLAKATQYMQMARPYLNQQTWPTIRQQMQQIGAPDNMLPKENASPEELHQFVWGSDIMGAIIKKGPTTHKPGDTIEFMGKREVIPYGEKEQSVIDKNKAMTDYWSQKDPNSSQTTKGMKRYRDETGKTQSFAINDPNLNERLPDGREKWTEVKGPLLSNKTLEWEGMKYVLTGKTSAYGMGGADARIQIQEYGNNVIAPKLGINPGQRFALPAVIKSTETALNNLQKNESMVTTAVNNFDKNIQQVEKYMEKISRTKAPLFTKWKQMGIRAATGDPDLSALDTALKVCANEIARITTAGASGGGGQVAEREIQEQEKILAAWKNLPDLKETIKVAKADTRNRKESFYEEREVLTNRLKNITNIRDNPKILFDKPNNDVKKWSKEQEDKFWDAYNNIGNRTDLDEQQKEELKNRSYEAYEEQQALRDSEEE